MNIERYYKKGNTYYISSSANRIGAIDIINSDSDISDINTNSDSDITISSIYRMLNISRSIPYSITNYIAINNDTIINDNTIYSDVYGNKGTISSAITNRSCKDIDFVRKLTSCYTMLKAPSISDYYTNTDIAKSRYYRNIAIVHTNIAIAISQCLPTNREYITIPSASVSIKISIVVSDMYRHIITSNSYISKISTPITSYDNSEVVECPTINVNTIKRGSSAISLLTDSRTERYNDKNIKDIIPSDMIFNTDEYLPTISAMRIDSGIAPSVVWTGNSRDYMIIGVVDYDTTNYYVVYSTLVYSDSDIYDSIYNHYNGKYTTYRKYAMDTSIHKYLTVFNDNEYVSYAFKGSGNTPKNISKYDIHNSYMYDKEYYYYSIHKDSVWEEWDNVILEYGSIRPTNYIKHTFNNKGSRDNSYICRIMYNNPTNDYCTNYIGSAPTTLKDYVSKVVDSINIPTMDNTVNNNSGIIRNAVNVINGYITDFLLSGKDTTILEESKLVLIDEYHKTLNRENESLYKKDLFDPNEEKMYKGTSRRNPNNSYYIYNPTYYSGRITMVSSITRPSGYKGQKGKVGDNMPSAPTMKTSGAPTLPNSGVVPLGTLYHMINKVPKSVRKEGNDSMYSSTFKRTARNYRRTITSPVKPVPCHHKVCQECNGGKCPLLHSLYKRERDE